PRGHVPEVHRRGAAGAQGARPGHRAIPHHRSRQSPELPRRWGERGLLHRLRRLGWGVRVDSGHLRVRGRARRQPRHVCRAEPARRDAAAVAVVRRRPVLPGGASQLLRKVLARPRHQQPGVWLPIRRRRWLLVVHLARRSAVPTRRGGVVTMRTNKLRKILAVLSVVAVSVISAVLVHEAHAAGTLISQGKPVTASSVENAGTPASAAVDGDTGTRWSSAFGDPQWIQVDLGASATIDQVVLVWEAAYATAFQIQTSANGSSWQTVYSTTTGTGGRSEERRVGKAGR